MLGLFPPPPRLSPRSSRVRKDARGILDPRWTTTGSTSPTALSRAQRPPRWWGNVRGTLEGWGCYIRPARGGESSVRPRGAYRLHCIGWHDRAMYSAANRRSASCTRGMHTTQLSLPLPRRAGKALEDSGMCCCVKTTTWKLRTVSSVHLSLLVDRERMRKGETEIWRLRERADLSLPVDDGSQRRACVIVANLLSPKDKEETCVLSID